MRLAPAARQLASRDRRGNADAFEGSSQSFDQRPQARAHRSPLAAHHTTKRCQAMWQLAIRTAVYIANERGDRAFKVALLEIVKCSFLATPDIFLARHISY
jgi:hypothetical protein